MDARLTDKVTIVTGGSRGIGRAIVELLAAEGADVTFFYRDNATAAEEVVSAGKAAGRRIVADKVDIRDSAACAAAVERVAEMKHSRERAHVKGIDDAAVATDDVDLRHAIGAEPERAKQPGGGDLDRNLSRPAVLHLDFSPALEPAVKLRRRARRLARNECADRQMRVDDAGVGIRREIDWSREDFCPGQRVLSSRDLLRRRCRPRRG